MTRFEIEEEQLAFIRSLSIYKKGEKDEPSNLTEDIELISDTEEDKEDQEISRISSIRAGKRRKSILSEYSDIDKSDNDLVLLPIVPESQIRASGRVKKRPRALKGYEIG